MALKYQAPARQFASRPPADRAEAAAEVVAAPDCLADGKLLLPVAGQTLPRRLSLQKFLSQLSGE